jgi:predicted nucleic acid-binding protein
VNFLLDTNAVSEWVKPRPNPGLIRWMESADEDRLFLSVITVAELHYGVERMPAGMRRNHLERWLRLEVPLRFERRILPVSEEIAVAWGKIVSLSESAGHAFIAATAQVHDLTLVTRNIDHFRVLKAVLSPWT